jgi:CRP/FNR family transcriptional regulator
MSKKKTNCDLASCFLCTHSQPEWRQLVALHKETSIFKRGESLFNEGDPVNGIYFVLQGAVKIHKHWGSERELIIRFATSNDIVGLRGLGAPMSFPISATALEETKACFIPIDFLEASFKANPGLTYEVLHFYAMELQRTEKRMSDIAHMDVKGRIAVALLAVKNAFGMAEDGFLGIAISRQDIASYAGTIYETVFKVFTEWINGGIIITEGKRIKIVDQTRLAVLAG